MWVGENTLCAGVGIHGMCVWAPPAVSGIRGALGRILHGEDRITARGYMQNTSARTSHSGHTDADTRPSFHSFCAPTNSVMCTLKRTTFHNRTDSSGSSPNSLRGGMEHSSFTHTRHGLLQASALCWPIPYMTLHPMPPAQGHFRPARARRGTVCWLEAQAPA